MISKKRRRRRRLSNRRGDAGTRRRGEGSSPRLRVSASPRLVSLFLLLLGCAPRENAPLVDDLGRHVALGTTPRRVVSLAPNLTELIVAAGAQDRLVGTDNFSDYPSAVKSLPKVGDMQPNIELIAQLRPDVVFAVSTANHPALKRSLQNLGIPLFVVRTDRLSDVPRVVTLLGEVLGTSSAARLAADRIREQLRSQRRVRSPRPRVLFAVWLDPLYVSGVETFVDDLIELAGGINAVKVAGWPQYSLESVAAQPPDLILVASPVRSREALGQSLQKTAPWNELEAVKSGFWYVLDENSFARPGPRVVDAAAELNRAIDQWEHKQSPGARSGANSWSASQSSSH